MSGHIDFTAVHPFDGILADIKVAVAASMMCRIEHLQVAAEFAVLQERYRATEKVLQVALAEEGKLFSTYCVAMEQAHRAYLAEGD